MDTEVTSRRGQYAPTRRRREQIADAVLSIVNRDGHDAVNVPAVAEIVGVSEGTIVYHFPTKDDLFVGALELVDNRAGEASHVDDLELTISPEHFLVHEESNVNLLRLTALMRGLAAMPTHPAAKFFAQRNQHQIDVFARAIEHRQQAGLAHPHLDPRQVARQVVALWDGLTSAWMVDDSIDVGTMLADGFRRLSGENWMRAKALLDREELGL